MAGRGPAPKAQGQRRHRNQPQRGEWVDLEPIAKPVLPTADSAWSAPAKRLWAAWRLDPVSATFGPGDVEALREFARQYDDLAPNEQRLRMDGFGLTPKGRRDLRLRLPSEQEPAGKPLAQVAPLKVVRDSAA
jgi:hypothetical protein